MSMYKKRSIPSPVTNPFIPPSNAQKTSPGCNDKTDKLLEKNIHRSSLSKSHGKIKPNVRDIKRGKSMNSIFCEVPREPEPVEEPSNDNNSQNKYVLYRKLSKKYIKKKLSKLFRSTSKLSDKTYSENDQNNENINSRPAKNCENFKIVETSSDALRNISFTAAMMAKDMSSPMIVSPNDDDFDHARQIPSSALRFWKQPSEEKLRAIQRRSQDNFFGSSDIVIRNNTKNPSELSLFYDDQCCRADSIRHSTSDVRSTVNVPGYDKAFYRYQCIVNQSSNRSRKDRALSMAYDEENNQLNNYTKMRSCQSSGSLFTYTDSKNNALNRLPQKHIYAKRIPPNCLIGTMKPAGSPPPYDKTNAGKKSRPRAFSQLPKSSKTTPIAPVMSADYPHCRTSMPPKPPPRSDSLIRSFELICHHLTTSISQPRGDSFKIFKSQSDYQAWLQNLPYSNPNKISSLLRQRSKLARRQCVSELIDDHILELGGNRNRRHSWPLTQCQRLNHESSSKRSSSLSRLKNKNKQPGAPKKAESPSLHSYSRLYSLRKSEGNSPNSSSISSKSTDAKIKLKSLQSPTLSGRSRKQITDRQFNEVNYRMTESCHESANYDLI